VRGEIVEREADGLVDADEGPAIDQLLAAELAQEALSVIGGFDDGGSL
jgi:hypothetical protein